MLLAKIRGKMKFEGSIGLSRSYPVYIQWICLKFCMKDRSGVLMICTNKTVSRENKVNMKGPCNDHIYSGSTFRLARALKFSRLN